MGNVPWVDLPPWALAGIVVLGLIQLCLQVLALVNAFRTPEERLVTGRRWVWVLVIVVGQLVGTIIYFAAARTPVVQEDPIHSRSASDASARAEARKAADLLYDSSSEKEDRRKGR